jgi:hypothetical protein
MTTLSDIMRGAWTDLGMAVFATATGIATPSATSFSDANTKYTTDDALVNGTCIIVSTTDGLAPQGKFAKITDFVASTKVFTIDTVTEVINTGDVVALVRPTIPSRQMQQAVNDALKDHIGTISLVDTSLTSVGGYKVYDLPAGMMIKKLVDVQLEPSGVYPNIAGTFNVMEGAKKYESIMGRVEILPSATVGKMTSHDLPAGLIIRIVYEGIHPELTTYSSAISETVPESLLKAGAVEKALTWLVSKRGDSALGTFLLQKLNDARQTIAQAKQEHPVNRVRKAARWWTP